MNLGYIAIITGSFAMLVVVFLIYYILRLDSGTPRMKEVASFIRTGAYTFLRVEYITISFFIVAISITLWLVLGWQIGLGFAIGAICSLLAAFIGMSIAVQANVKTANMARTNANKALVVAFRGGAVTGLSIVGISLIGLGSLFFAFGENPSMLVGFGFGASLAALFAQLGGGIYTKAADVGADIVGKVENRIPEDDPRNPAAIADQVGDNVGDCAGRGADLFESFSDNIIGAMILGTVFVSIYGNSAIIFPLLIESVGVISSIIAVLTIRGTKGSPAKKVYMSFFISGILSLAGFFVVSYWVMDDMRLFAAVTLGLVMSLIVAVIVYYYTATGARVTKKIAEGSQSGPAINIILGLAYGLESPVLPLVVIGGVSVGAYFITGNGLAGIYGISAATMGVLVSTGIIMASDTFGPIADNADGIAEMAGVADEVGTSLEELDGVGNVTKAVTKGYAMATCILTAVVILFAYLTEAARDIGDPLVNINDIIVNISHPIAIAALFIGASIPFLFSALTIKAVGKTAFEMADEVRRQFKENPGILAGTSKPDYNKCIDISTKNALREMILPTAVGVVIPIAMGFLVGVWYLAVYLLAVKVVSGLLAMFMYNAGGAWDNAKKYIELGHFGGKNTDTHAASVIGDTVGDPLKDTAGPSLHILVKLQNILAITLLPLFLKYALIKPI